MRLCSRWGALMQPFGMKMFRGIVQAHKDFVSRTVMVKDNDVDQALRLLNRLMSQEGILNIIRRTQRFEKPCKQRRRLAYEQCKAIYDEDMNRKIQLLMRKNRKDPRPGLY